MLHVCVLVEGVDVVFIFVVAAAVVVVVVVAAVVVVVLLLLSSVVVLIQLSLVYVFFGQWLLLRSCLSQE